MIADVIVGVWVATFAYLANRWRRTRARTDQRIGYLAEPDRRPLPLPAPSLDLLVDLADPSVERPEGARKSESAEAQYRRHNR